MLIVLDLQCVYFMDAVGKVELGPSRRAPAGSIRRWTGGIWTMIALIFGCNAGLSEDFAAEQRLRCQS